MLARKAILPLIVAGFAYFLSDYLTWSTLIFCFFCVGSTFFKMKLPKKIRIVSVLIIIASYILIYGKIFDPEVGLNFLTSVVMLKILESETDRDKYMIFFGLILLVAAGALFEKSLEYTFFLLGSFLFLLSSFHQDREVKWVKKEIAVTLLLILPLVGILFFFVPRIMSPISLFRAQNQKGKIGYSKSVNMDEVDSLSPSDEIAFYAVVPETVPRHELYWRGNALSLTDGWNWLESAKTQGVSLRDEEFEFKGLKQEIFLPKGSDYFFMLDWPLAHRTEFRDQKIGESGTLAQERRDKIKSYTVWSQKTSTEEISSQKKSLKISGLKARDKDWIRKTFQANEVSELLNEMSGYFRNEKFSYTLSPGKVASFSEFMNIKKGFCTHFASATAQILRTKGISTRLVSGYMGGLYNQVGGYYQVTENDAHVWVEVESQGKWKRIDPTEWISPERVNLGGDAFVKEQAGTQGLDLGRYNPFKTLGFLQDLRLEFERLNFIFYRLMDEMNYFTQLTLLRKFGLGKKLIFFIIPIVVLAFAGLYLLIIQFSRREKDLETLAWEKFQSKLESSDKKTLNSLGQIGLRIETLKNEKRELAQSIFNSLISHSYRGESVILRDVIRNIRKL